MVRKKRYTEPIGVMVEREIYETLTKICEREDQTLSNWIREAIQLKLKQDENNNQQKIGGYENERQYNFV